MGSTTPTEFCELGIVDDDGYSSDSTITQHLLQKEKGGDMSSPDDVESQKPYPTKDTTSGSHAAEYSVPARTKYLYLGLYFGLNLSLTLFNKAVLGKASLEIFDDVLLTTYKLTYSISSLSLGSSPPFIPAPLRSAALFSNGEATFK